MYSRLGRLADFSRYALQRCQNHQIARAASNPKPAIKAVAIATASDNESSVSLSGSPGSSSPGFPGVGAAPPADSPMFGQLGPGDRSAGQTVGGVGCGLVTNATIECRQQDAHPRFWGPSSPPECVFTSHGLPRRLLGAR
jgi:hypothetical protein